MPRHTCALPAARRSPERLAALLPLLRCPLGGGPLARDGDHLRGGGQEWPIVSGAPVLFPGLEPKIHPAAHVSHGLPPRALDLIEGADGLVLNVSAGGTDAPPPHVVEAEAGLFRNTDVVADAHALPFADGAFAGVLAINAFEHYRDPPAAAREIWRVLRPGGQVLIHTAFLQPLHEAPHHYYNCTEYGLRRWFEPFDEVDLTVSENFHPLHVFAWLSEALRHGLAGGGSAEAADALAAVTLGDLAAYWRAPAEHAGLRALFDAIPLPLQRQMAAGFEYRGRKPG